MAVVPFAAGIFGEAQLAATLNMDLASVSNLFIEITGAASIGSFGSTSRKLKFLRFAGASIITHGTIICPGATSIQCAAGDRAIVYCNNSGVWHVIAFEKNSAGGGSNVAYLNAAAVFTAQLKADASTGIELNGGGQFYDVEGTCTVFKPDSNEIRFYATNLASVFQYVKNTYVAPGTDNAVASGQASTRWSVVYAATGTINTSDERDKENIEPVDDKVLDAWSEVEFYQFKFKGGKRKHVGVIAQRIEKAFKKHGIDAFEYGLLCYDKWDEAEIKHPVEGEYEVTDPVVVKHLAVKDKIPAYRTVAEGEVEMPEVEVEVEPEREEVVVPPIRIQVKPPSTRIEKVPAGDRYGIRPDECMFLEMALQRRELQRLKAR